MPVDHRIGIICGLCYTARFIAGMITGQQITR